MRDGQQQVGVTRRAEGEQLVQRLTLEPQSERVLSLRRRDNTQRLVPLPGRLVALEVVGLDPESQQRVYAESRQRLAREQRLGALEREWGEASLPEPEQVELAPPRKRESQQH
jgi:hypothetical protein